MLGADHAGYVGRYKALVAAMGDDPEEHLEILLGQLVNLVRDGEPVRMSKRAGTVVLLADLVEAVGADAARYALARSSVDQQIDLDLDLWSRQTNDNPVFYVQYAHARISSLLRNAADLGLSLGEAGRRRCESAGARAGERPAARDRRVPPGPHRRRRAPAPHRVARYLEELAGTYHRFYDSCRVLRAATRAGPQTTARLWACAATATVLRNGLAVLGVHAQADVSAPAGPLHGNIAQPTAAGAPPADLGALDPHVWPRSAERIDGELHLGGRPVTELARTHGTPLFVLDEGTSAGGPRTSPPPSTARTCTTRPRPSSADRSRGGWPRTACTSAPAAATSSAWRWPRASRPSGSRCTATTSRSSNCGWPSTRASGTSSSTRSTRSTGWRLAGPGGGGGSVPCSSAVIGIEAHTHEFIATAHEDQKFGFSLATGDALTAAVRIIREPHLELTGLHSHIGSQIFDTAGFEAAAHRVVGLLGQLRQATGEVLAELNLGGGFGIAYLSEDDPVSPADVAARLEVVAAECAGSTCPCPAGGARPRDRRPGTVTIYEIGTIKPVRLGASGAPGTLVRNYVSVDGGMSDNIRTALYDASYTCVLASRSSDAPPALCRVVGKHCESGDILVRDLWLPADVTPGDLLAVAATGAYCWSMASNYNYLLKPPVVAVKDGAATEIVGSDPLGRVRPRCRARRRAAPSRLRPAARNGQARS